MLGVPPEPIRPSPYVALFSTPTGAGLYALTLNGEIRTFGGRTDASARLLLMPGDLYVISGQARHRWEHGVPFVKEDYFGGCVYPRSKGWSVSWRLVDRNTLWSSEFT